jgi:hypothetical protein
VIQALQEEAEVLHPENWRKHGGILLLVKAVAHLRRAEQENCVTGHNQDSCLLPIRGQGVHRRREGASRALQVLSEVLENDPGNLRARWLLNVAHMTLGGYPEQVPARDLIPPAAFAPEHALPRFENVAPQAGVDVYGLSGGAILDDFDRDGLLDLMVSAIGFGDQLRFFRNEGDGAFADRTAQAGLTGETGGLNLVQAHYDNDGWVDALVLRGGWLGSEGNFRSRSCATTATARSPTSRAPRACPTSLRRRPPPGSTTTGTAGSTCSWATSPRPGTSIPANCSTTRATAPSRKWRVRPGSTWWAS